MEHFLLVECGSSRNILWKKTTGVLEDGCKRKFKSPATQNLLGVLVVFLSGTIQDYMCEYMKQQSESLKGYLIATFDSREHYLSLLDQSLGTSTKSEDIKLCEMMASAGLFREEIKITRDGRNHYKLFYLTDTGREIAKKIKEEGYSGPIPQSTPIDNI
jgi:hypothetical protein